MRLVYHTGWDSAAVHYGVRSGGEWRTSAMSDTPGAPGWKTAELPQEVSEFVVRNGEGTEWDNPPPEVGTKNYEVPATSSGEPPAGLTLSSGRLAHMASIAPVLVVSDLDHTMVGHEKDPQNEILHGFLNAWLTRYHFSGSRLVYSTGRNKSDALAVAREVGLIRPALLVCAVGTEVYIVPEDLPLGPGGAWADDPSRITLEPGWTALMEKSFERAATEELLKERFPKFEMRGNPETDPYRIPTAYEVDENFQDNLALVKEALGPKVEVIASGGAEWKLVDFCSADAGKLKACQFVMQRLGFAPEQTLVCGDSGNDESMYRCPGVRGVAVGNALPELVAALQGMAKAGPEAVLRGSAFTTKLDSTVLYAEREVSGAIAEAIERFWPTSS